jgi:hypothetical protein
MKNQTSCPGILGTFSHDGVVAHRRDRNELPVSNKFLVGNMLLIKQRFFQSADNDSAAGGDNV